MFRILIPADILPMGDIYIWAISFHAVVVFALGKNLLFKSVLGHCASTSIALLAPRT